MISRISSFAGPISYSPATTLSAGLHRTTFSGLIDVQAANFYGTLVGTMAAPVTNFGNADATLVIGVNYGDTNLTAPRTWTLPTSPTAGQSVKVKAPSNCDATNYITIQRAGSQTIDGETSIRLESSFAGVELVYVASNLWRVF